MKLSKSGHNHKAQLSGINETTGYKEQGPNDTTAITLEAS